MGPHLADHGLVPRLVISSTAVRARTTAELAIESGDWGSELWLEPGFYGSSVDEVVDLVSRKWPDLGLPDGSGWDLLPDIKAALPNSRLVILTGQDATQIDLRKVDSVLLKSGITPRELLAAIQAGLRGPA